MTEIAPTPKRDISKYDPKKGLKTIADAEAGEKHWRRAKNPEKLFEAIEAKIKAQADYVIWRDAAMRAVVAMRGGGGPGRGKKGAASARVLLPDGDPGQEQQQILQHFC